MIFQDYDDYHYSRSQDELGFEGDEPHYEDLDEVVMRSKAIGAASAETPPPTRKKSRRALSSGAAADYAEIQHGRPRTVGLLINSLDLEHN